MKFGSFKVGLATRNEPVRAMARVPEKESPVRRLGLSRPVPVLDLTIVSLFRKVWGIPAKSPLHCRRTSYDLRPPTRLGVCIQLGGPIMSRFRIQIRTSLGTIW